MSDKRVWKGVTAVSGVDENGAFHEEIERQALVPASSLEAAEAELAERVKECAAAWDTCEARRIAQEKAERDRDEALGLLKRCADAFGTLGVHKDAEAEIDALLAKMKREG